MVTQIFVTTVTWITDNLVLQIFRDGIAIIQRGGLQT
jgi:hypothetical protein